MLHWARALVAGAVVFCSLSAVAALPQTASVYMKSDPGSYVGGGIGAEEVTWVHGIDGVFTASTNFDQGISINYQGDEWWSFDFAAPEYDPVTNTVDGQPLVERFYNNATRFPFNSPTKPGLSVSGAGRGNNTLSGWFNVLEVDYDVGGEVRSFAVDFRQFGESSNLTGPSLYGSMRYNSSIPLTLVPVPEPETFVMVAVGLAGILVARRRQK